MQDRDTGALAGLPDNVWTYHAPRTGRLTVTTEGGWSFAKYIFVWHGDSVQNLIPLGAEEVKSIAYPVVQDAELQICVSSLYSSDGGPIVLTFRLNSNSDLNSFNLTGAAFDNNNFARPYPLIGDSPAVVTYTAAASREALEPEETGYKTVWFSWTAGASGSTKILTDGSDSYTKRIVVYTGTSINALTKVAEAQPASRPTLSFNADAGQTYAISVGSLYASDGRAVLLALFAQPGQLAQAANLWIARAVKVVFQTEPNRRYRIQKSSDFKVWESIGDLIYGDGGVHDVFVDANDSLSVFRVAVQ